MLWFQSLSATMNAERHRAVQGQSKDSSGQNCTIKRATSSQPVTVNSIHQGIRSAVFFFLSFPSLLEAGEGVQLLGGGAQGG